MIKTNAAALNDSKLDVVTGGGFFDFFKSEPTNPVDKAIEKVKEVGIIALSIAGAIAAVSTAAKAMKDIAEKGYC